VAKLAIGIWRAIRGPPVADPSRIGELKIDLAGQRAPNEARAGAKGAIIEAAARSADWVDGPPSVELAGLKTRPLAAVDRGSDRGAVRTRMPVARVISFIAAGGEGRGMLLRRDSENNACFRRYNGHSETGKSWSVSSSPRQAGTVSDWAVAESNGRRLGAALKTSETEMGQKYHRVGSMMNQGLESHWEAFLTVCADGPDLK